MYVHRTVPPVRTVTLARVRVVYGYPVPIRYTFGTALSLAVQLLAPGARKTKKIVQIKKYHDILRKYLPQIGKGCCLLQIRTKIILDLQNLGIFARTSSTYFGPWFENEGDKITTVYGGPTWSVLYACSIGVVCWFRIAIRTVFRIHTYRTLGQNTAICQP